MRALRPSILIFISLYAYACSAQQEIPLSNPNVSQLFYNDHSVITNITDSGQYILLFNKSMCKGYFIQEVFSPSLKKSRNINETAELVYIKKGSTKFLTVHGNISYDFFYRSKIDTPFSQTNLQQHTERVMLDITVKEKYPFKVYFTARQSNSPYFRNFFDPNFQFDKYAYAQNVKQIMIDKLMARANIPGDLKKLQDSLNDLLNKYSKLKINTESPATLQTIIEQKERASYVKPKISGSEKLIPNERTVDGILSQNMKFKFTSKYDSTTKKIDSLRDKLEYSYESRKKEADSLLSLIQKNKNKIDSIKNSSLGKLNAAKQKIYKAADVNELTKLAAEYGLEVKKPGKFEKILSAVKSFSIGRAMINYTELTAQNILVTGVNIEYNPSYYIAVAAGKIDYRFRDFFNRNSKNNNQYLVLGRLGVGNKDRKAVIFTMFKGRKNQSEYALSDSVDNHVNIVGYSIETIYRKDQFTYLSAEFAKSTKPVTGNLNNNKQINNLWQFDDMSNMGINIKAQTRIPETNTRLSGFYRKTGANFQSFSLFSYYTDQTAWQARVDQELLKHRVTFTAMVRRNDFVNPFTDKTFKTNTTFTSLLLNIHFPKYPSLSLGYYPGTQVYIVNKERIRENAYYILNGTATYSYFFKGIRMNSTVVYNQYFNKATDSGFVLYKGTNYYATQILFLKKLQLQGGYAYSNQPELKYYTLEGSAEYSFKKVLKLGAGLKYNKIAGGQNHWGERASLSADLKKLGTFQLQYEKNHLPTIDQTLYPVETGRVSWYKYF